MNKKAYAFFLKKNRKRKKSNPIAKVLKFFTPKVIRDKKKYRREDGRLWKRKIWEPTGD
tara:strand:+ start:118 stop:294 length:177 start_codon:yes stop_codon:yes gene_type:complete